VVGDAVNTASRIEAIAPAGGVAIGAETFSRLGPASVESLGRIDVKGKSAPLEVYHLIELPEG
jgi:class 3 adenylate cyclase